ncbi:uncharacterized protein LOC111042491 [Myzus persicae]|uniref:uncharacterized protein LOC111042491 n=1 Tax=Myzus persicae TaxID=13164 RepID=UPI000B9375A9|nr:uncharacterized protein LOC111042491 [Myzus persicae]
MIQPNVRKTVVAVIKIIKKLQNPIGFIVQINAATALKEDRPAKKVSTGILSNLEIVQSYRMYCPKACGRSYIGAHRKYNLKRHLLFECGVKLQFQCQVCQKRFSQKSNMKTHCLLVIKNLCKLIGCIVQKIVAIAILELIENKISRGIYYSNVEWNQNFNVIFVKNYFVINLL